MKIHLAYGKDGLDIEVPDKNLMKVLTIEGAPPLQNLDRIVRQSLLKPIEAIPLRQIASKAGSACVVICDITRPVPNKVLLPPILQTLEENGIDRGRITILVATGLHRPSTEEERRLMVGDEILNSYNMFDHHARILDQQVFLGRTMNNTPVLIDKRYTEAELKITVGFIEPHLMAGFSGGRKMVAPGCAAEETIKALHSPFFLENPYCREGSMEQNPLHHELLEIARMAGHDFMVDVSSDAEGNITGVFAGNPQTAHAEGVKFVRTSVRSTIERPADIVITTSAGFPLDLTYYQAVKGITAALPVVKKAGMLILAAECAEGLGSREFSKLATNFASADAFHESILKNPVIIDQWQLEECVKGTRHAEVILVSKGIREMEKEKLFVKSAPTVEEALEQGFRKLGSNASVAVIPKGPYTLVEVGADGASD